MSKNIVECPNCDSMSTAGDFCMWCGEYINDDVTDDWSEELDIMEEIEEEEEELELIEKFNILRGEW